MIVPKFADYESVFDSLNTLILRGADTRQRVILQRSFAAMLGCVIGLSACMAQTVASPMDAASAPESQTISDDEQVLDFLRKLKRVVDEDLLDQPQLIEEIMGFRVTGWRDEAEDNAYSSVRNKTPKGSFGGMAAFVSPLKHRLNAALPEFHFYGVSNTTGRTPSIRLKHLEEVFGSGYERVGPGDFHRLSGGLINYAVGPRKNIKLVFTMGSIKNFVVVNISAYAVSH